GASALVTTCSSTGRAPVPLTEGVHVGEYPVRCCQLSHSWGESAARNTTGAFAPSLTVTVSVATSPFGRLASKRYFPAGRSTGTPAWPPPALIIMLVGLA